MSAKESLWLHWSKEIEEKPDRVRRQFRRLLHQFGQDLCETLFSIFPDDFFFATYSEGSGNNTTMSPISTPTEHLGLDGLAK